MHGGEGDGVGRFLIERIRTARATHIIPAYSMLTYGVPISAIFSNVLTHIPSIVRCSSGGDARGRGIRAHALGVKAPVAVEHTLVILHRRHEPCSRNCDTWPWVCRDVGGNPSQMHGWEGWGVTMGESEREREG